MGVNLFDKAPVMNQIIASLLWEATLSNCGKNQKHLQKK
jgi:hypothetical protein